MGYLRVTLAVTINGTEVPMMMRYNSLTNRTSVWNGQNMLIWSEEGDHSPWDVKAIIEDIMVCVEVDKTDYLSLDWRPAINYNIKYEHAVIDCIHLN
jgi:hypothetical protein